MTTLRAMAWLCAACVLAIVSLSAGLRLTKAGLGCADWPRCYGQELRATAAAPAPSATTTVLRLAHRIVATAALMLVTAMVLACLGTRPRLWREGRIALALLACALFLAVLGVRTPGAHVPAVAMGNLLGGFVMLALCWRMARSAGIPAVADSERSGLSAWAWIGVVLLVWQIALGALVSASFAGLSCPALLACDAAASSWQTLDPWREPRLAAAGSTHPAGALAHILHRASALLVAAVLLAIAAMAWRRGRRRAAVALVVLLVVQVALGLVLVIGKLPLPAALGHNLVAALLLAVAVDLTLARPHLR